MITNILVFIPCWHILEGNIISLKETKNNLVVVWDKAFLIHENWLQIYKKL